MRRDGCGEENRFTAGIVSPSALLLTMHRKRHIVVLLAALWAGGVWLSAYGAAGTAGAPLQVYKWVDDKGVLHYGDSVPSEYAQAERSVLNSQGVEVGHVDSRKSDAQEAAQLQLEQSSRQRAQHDQFLLSTYVSAKDIEQLRDERLGQVDGQIKASLTYVDSLGTRLAALVERALRCKPYSSDPAARRMPDDLAEELVHTANEARSQRQALEAKRKAQSDMRAQFESDLQRYRELTTRSHS